MQGRSDDEVNSTSVPNETTESLLATTAASNDIRSETRAENISLPPEPSQKTAQQYQAMDKDNLYINRCMGGASGTMCNFDDFVGIDLGSLEGTGQGEDRFCGSKLLEHDYIICKFDQFFH